jgi:amphi-Trp domain-containing protein
MKDVLYKSQAQMNRRDTADYLRRLADRIEENRVVLQDGQQETPVELPEEIELEVDHSSKVKKQGTFYKLELELKWGPGKGGLGLA